MSAPLRLQIAQEAARLVCEDQLTDYRVAKQKAVARLDLGPKAPLPDNAMVHAAVLDYLRLFGGDDYPRRLQHLRRAALDAMRRLAAFEPRLVGAVVSGAVTDANRVQLHVFSDRAETVELGLCNRGVDCEQGDRGYRYPDGSEVEIPLVRFDIDDIGVDVAVFETGTLHECPLNPLDGRPFERLDMRGVERLLDLPPPAPGL